MARDYAAVPHEYLEEMQILSDVEFGRLMRALLNYSRTGEPMALHGNEKFYVQRVMAEEDRHRRSYEETAANRAKAAMAGARARWQRMPEDAEGCQTQDTDTNTDSDSEPKRKSSFSYEKRAPRGRAAKKREEDPNAWMDEFIK